MKNVRIIQLAGYMKGEQASFEDTVADRLVSLGKASYVVSSEGEGESVAESGSPKTRMSGSAPKKKGGGQSSGGQSNGNKNTGSRKNLQE